MIFKKNLLVFSRRGARGAAPAGDGGAAASGRIRLEVCSLSGTTNPAASVVGGQNFCSSGNIIL